MNGDAGEGGFAVDIKLGNEVITVINEVDIEVQKVDRVSSFLQSKLKRKVERVEA